MTIEHNLVEPQAQDRNGETDLVNDDEVEVVASEGHNPEGAQEHPDVGTESNQASEDGPGEPVAMDLDVQLFALLETPVWVEVRSEHCHLVP